MRCALFPISYSVLRDFFRVRVWRAPGSTVVPSPHSLADLARKVSRAGFYRYLPGRAPVEECMIVRSAIQEIALEHRRRYGYRRVTAVLRRRGMMVTSA